MPAVQVQLAPKLHNKVLSFTKTHNTSVQQLVTNYLEYIVQKDNLQQQIQRQEKTPAQCFFGALHFDDDLLKEIVEEKESLYD